MDLEATERARLGRRSRTVSMNRMSKRAIDALTKHTDLLAEADPLPPRPQTFTECQARGIGTAESPCGYVSCKWHLALDVSEKTGAIKVNFPALDGDPDIDAMGQTCVRRVIAAHPDGLTLEEVGLIVNLTRERIRQVESKGLAEVSKLAALVKSVDEEIDDPELYAAAVDVADALDECKRDSERRFARLSQEDEAIGSEAIDAAYSRLAARADERAGRRMHTRYRNGQWSVPMLRVATDPAVRDGVVALDPVDSLHDAVSFGVAEVSR
jgi:hypothetical protein